MSATDVKAVMQQLLDQWMAPPLSTSGFRKTRQRFVRHTPDTIQLVDLQRSVSSTREEIRFTVNLGVQSKRIREFLQPGNQSAPNIDDCHWQVRLHQLAPSEVPEWVAITRATDVSELGRGLRMWLQIYALPTLEQFSSDVALTDLWMTGRSPGLTRYSRLVNTAVLLHAAERTDRLRQTLTELRELASGKPIEATVDELVARLSAAST